MPFVPSILEEKFNKYIKADKHSYPIFMTNSFDTTKEGKENLLAAPFIELQGHKSNQKI